MAKSARYTLNETTPTLVFSGSGNVAFRLVSGGQFPLIGGPDLTQSNGFQLDTQSNPLVLNVSSPDKIYALSPPGVVVTIGVLEVR